MICTDPDFNVSPEGLEYSVDPYHYVPMCTACHRAFDENRKKVNK